MRISDWSSDVCSSDLGNLGLTARGLFTPFIATHVSIRTSDTSSSPLEPPSQAYRTLSYRVRAHLNTPPFQSTPPLKVMERFHVPDGPCKLGDALKRADRRSTRLNSSH